MYIKKFNLFLNNKKLLNDNLNIIPLLYGSLGLEVLTNYDLNSDDIDILIPEIFLNKKWDILKKLLETNGYKLIDLHEHTFIKNNTKYSYASIENLKEFAKIELNEISMKDGYLLLNLLQYLKVYKASLNDSYRQNKKNKNDQEKIDFINSFIK